MSLESSSSSFGRLLAIYAKGIGFDNRSVHFFQSIENISIGMIPLPVNIINLKLLLKGKCNYVSITYWIFLYFLLILLSCLT